MKSQFTVLDSKTIFHGSVVNLITENLKLPSGRVITKEIVQHPGAIVVIPQITSTKLLLVRQYRHAVARALLEFPAGTLEAKEDPLECAKRELSEEVGHKAARWTELGHVYSAPGFCTERLYLFLAQGLTPHKLPADEDEFIEIEEMTVAAVEQAVANGAIVDAKSIAIFAKAKMLKLI